MHPERACPYGDVIKRQVNLLVLTRLKSKSVNVPLTPTPSYWCPDSWSILSSELDKCMEEFLINRPTAVQVLECIKGIFSSTNSSATTGLFTEDVQCDQNSYLMQDIEAASVEDSITMIMSAFSSNKSQVKILVTELHVSQNSPIEFLYRIFEN